MLLVHEKPILEYILNGLIYAGFKNLVFVVGYKKEQITDYFKNGEKWGVNLQYIEQKLLNGTGGALLECEKLIKGSHFFLTWGDVLVPYSIYKDILNLFKQKYYNFILVANYTKDPYLGAAVYIKNHYCLDIIEKPLKGQSKSNFNNCGIFILSKEIFKVLNSLKPSIRGEIELTEALKIGINRRSWKIRVIEMGKNQFRGDFGDLATYERLSEDSSWLKEIANNNANL